MFNEIQFHARAFGKVNCPSLCEDTVNRYAISRVLLLHDVVFVVFVLHPQPLVWTGETSVCLIITMRDGCLKELGES